jgi:hypothetical protein
MVFYKNLNQTLLKLNPNTSFNLYLQFLKVNIREGQKELNDLMYLVCVVGKFENEVNDLMRLLQVWMDALVEKQQFTIAGMTLF